MSDFVSRLKEGHEIVNMAVKEYNPSHVFALFSGGHDSLCSTHIASNHPKFSGVIHINTGIGIKETNEFVRDTCKKTGWTLHEYHPPVSYEELVIEQGFPGPGMHWKMYHRLKERCLRQVLRDFKDRKDRRRKIVFVSGRRKLESSRRMVNVDHAIVTNQQNPSGRVVWTNPLINWRSEDKNIYIKANKLKKNPVVELLCMSGECLCGAFAKPNELNEIRLWFPDAANNIDCISKRVKSAGKWHKWGQRPCRGNLNQLELPLCWSCENK